MSHAKEDAVWAHTRFSGSKLSVMLAIAKLVNKQLRYAYPSVKTIAKMVRLEWRQVHEILKDLEKSGELMIERGVGRRGTNHYRIALPDSETGMPATARSGGCVDKLPVALQKEADPPADARSGDLMPTADKPELNLINNQRRASERQAVCESGPMIATGEKAPQAEPLAAESGPKPLDYRPSLERRRQLESARQQAVSHKCSAS